MKGQCQAGKLVAHVLWRDETCADPNTAALLFMVKREISLCKSSIRFQQSMAVILNCFLFVVVVFSNSIGPDDMFELQNIWSL